MPSYELDPLPDNCYPGTSILINKLNIRDEDKLTEAETLFTFINSSRLELEPLEGNFDFENYKAIHKFLFDELYDWAGKVRIINISKKGTRFCPFNEIEGRAKLIFERLKKHNLFRGLKKPDFVREIVDFYCVTNELHPFREGNGRTQRSFLTQLIRNAGYDINFSDIDVELLMIATIQSSNGVNDLLQKIFEEVIFK